MRAVLGSHSPLVTEVENCLKTCNCSLSADTRCICDIEIRLKSPSAISLSAVSLILLDPFCTRTAKVLFS